MGDLTFRVLFAVYAWWIGMGALVLTGCRSAQGNPTIRSHVEKRTGLPEWDIAEMCDAAIAGAVDLDRPEGVQLQ